jgi:hypothetical protein
MSYFIIFFLGFYIGRKFDKYIDDLAKKDELK